MTLTRLTPCCQLNTRFAAACGHRIQPLASKFLEEILEVNLERQELIRLGAVFFVRVTKIVIVLNLSVLCVCGGG